MVYKKIVRYYSGQFEFTEVPNPDPSFLRLPYFPFHDVHVAKENSESAIFYQCHTYTWYVTFVRFDCSTFCRKRRSLVALGSSVPLQFLVSAVNSNSFNVGNIKIFCYVGKIFHEERNVEKTGYYRTKYVPKAFVMWSECTTFRLGTQSFIKG